MEGDVHNPGNLINATLLIVDRRAEDEPCENVTVTVTRAAAPSEHLAHRAPHYTT